MNVSISGRHMEMTDALQDHVRSGLEKIEHHFDRVIDVEVVLGVQKHRHMAEINLHANGLRLNAKDSSEDMYASIDSALNKLDRQITKHKDRIKNHKPRSKSKLRDIEHQVIEIAAAEQSDEPSNESRSGHRVIDREKVPLMSLDVHEAALQLELLEDSFLVFSNAETQQVNVLYSRDNGTYGLIEPQF